MNWIKKILICPIMASLLLSSCVNSPSLMLGDACKPPCWMEIYPGSTNIRDTVMILEEIESVHGVNTSEENIEDIKNRGFESWINDGRMQESSGRVYFQDDKVYYIKIDSKISIGEYIDKFGSPEKYLAVIERIEAVTVSMFLLYPTRGIIIKQEDTRYFGSWKGPLEIKANIKDWQIIYFAPHSIDDVLLKEVYITTPSTDVKTLEGAIRDWEGFGEIEPLNLLK